MKAAAPGATSAANDSRNVARSYTRAASARGTIVRTGGFRRDSLGFEPTQIRQVFLNLWLALMWKSWLGVRDDFRNWIIRAT